MAEPRLVYPPNRGTAVNVDIGVYSRLAAQSKDRQLLNQFEIPPRDGKAWIVKAGQICRIVAIQGPQVGDFNAWNLHNPRERFWSARSKQLHRTHISTFDRLWSCLPYLRPMITITGDSIGYQRDADGAGCHDILGTRCDPYVNTLLGGDPDDHTCHSNLVRAILPYHLDESDVHDVLNVFMVTGISPEGRYFVKPSPANRGDFLEFFAEIDLLCALSTCPQGDLSIPPWGPDAGDPSGTCRPLGVEIFETPPELLRDWEPPKPVQYGGSHGLALSKT
ncbi:urea carboxylase-associated family protein [SAR202 cluster bacterium AD-804-J14_MRT_500m]|nr:urea carboxylase-associated family protein [SAR202 cluster bacterium AD-804-J14_MRT_500m]